MIWLGITLFISLVANAFLLHAGLRMSSRNEEYEGEIIRFYEGTQLILATARALDEKEMFEKDDDVGVLFQQLLIVIGELRVLIYGSEEEEEE